MTKVSQITQFASTSTAGKFKKTTIDVPKLKAFDILIELLYCGVCHTDCVYMGKDGLVLGHEPIGRVVDKGDKVDRFDIGDIVGTSYLKWACLECRECVSGHDTMCEKRYMFPEGNLNGFASHQVADSRFSFKIPKNLDPKQASVLMCAGITVFNALYSVKVSPTARIAVIGIGGLGHLALQFARAWGCHVTAISHSTNKQEEAKKFGAHDFLVDTELFATKVKESEKFDFIFDTVSQDIAYENYFNILKRNGTFTLIGLPERPVTIQNPLGFLQNQLDLKGTIIGGRYAIDLMLEFAERHNIKAQLEEYPFDLEGLEKAIDRCSKSEARYRAVLVKK